MTRPLRLLIVEDSEDDAVLVTRQLTGAGWTVQPLRVDTPEAMERALTSQEWDLVVADCAMPRFNASAALQSVRSRCPDVPFVIVSGTITEEAAAVSMRAGAHDYVTKGNLARLIPVVERELAEAEGRRMRRAAEAEVARQEDIFRDTIDRAPLGIAHSDATTGEWLRVNQALCDILGYTREELFRLSFEEITYPEDLPAELDLRRSMVRGEIEKYELKKRYYRKDGSLMWADTSLTLIKPRGSDPMVMAIVEDVTHYVESRLALQESERRFRLLFANNPVPMWVYDPGTLKFLEVNEAAVKHYGYTAEEFGAMTLTDIRPASEVPALMENLSKPAESRTRHEWRHIKKAGQVIDVDVSVMLLESEGHPAALVVAQDITARKRYERSLTHDGLTELVNREYLTSKLDTVLGGRSRDSMVAVFLLDMDRFRDINDTFGHRHGDLLLQEVARRVRGTVGRKGIVARIGGDEFAVALPVCGLQDVARAAREILQALSASYDLEGLSLDLSASIGVALSPVHGQDVATLLRRADVAMYGAKRRRSGFEFYDPDRDENTPERLALIGELRRAIEKDELVLHYQPQASLAGDAICGAEALVRWMHPVHGLLPPDRFLPIAEHTDLIRPLTRWVLRNGARQLRTWRNAGCEVRLSVNISARNLHDDAFVSDIRSALSESGVPPHSLTVELTETSVMDDPESAIQTLSQIHEMGVRMSIDDFGTGHSSMAYLKRLPVDEIKIDRSFVTDMTEGSDEAFIVRSTIQLGHNLGAVVVAEGVETPDVRKLLATLGCDVIQGYLLGRPMDAASMTEFLRLGLHAARSGAAA